MIIQGVTLARDAAPPLLVDALGRAIITGQQYNGASYEDIRGNQGVTARAVGAYTTTYASGLLANPNGRGVLVMLNVTAVPGAQTLTPVIYGTLPSGNSSAALLTGAAITATGLYSYLVYPGAVITGTALTAVTSVAVPRNWFLQLTHSGAGSWTYELAYQLTL